MAYKLHHLHLKAPDTRKTAQWYVDYLGAKIVSENQSPSGQVAFRLDLHGVAVNVSGFAEGRNMEQHYGLEHLAVATGDFATQVERIKASGVRVLEELTLDDGRHVCFFEGPEGVRVEFMSVAG